MFAVLLAASLLGQPTIDPTAVPSFPATMAVADSKALPEGTRQNYRYIWCRGGTDTELAVLGMAINHSLNRNILPVAVGGPAMTISHGGHLVRLDLTLLASKPAELSNLLETWEKLVNVETDFIATVKTRSIVDVKPFKRDGKTFNKQWVEQTALGAAVHVNTQMVELLALTGSVVPIVESRTFLVASLGTLEGGLYYEFRGLPANIKLADYLRRVGVVEEHAKLFEVPGAAVKSDTIDKAVVMTSQVTGKERMIVMLPTAGVRPTEGRGLAVITIDFFNDSRQEHKAAGKNLVDARADGFEVMVILENGYVEFTVWNGDFTLFRSAPDRLVSDRKVGEPHPTILEGAASCIRCHGPEDGWKSFHNDLPDVLEAGIDIFGDLSTNTVDKDLQQQLAGMYTGDWFAPGIGPISSSRITYDRAVFSVTGKPLKDCAAAMEAMYNEFLYEELDPWDVARELGINGLPPSDNDPNTVVDRKAAAKALWPFISAKPSQPGQVIVQEDGDIAYIRAGVPIYRRTYNRCKHLLLERVQNVLNQGAVP